MINGAASKITLAKQSKASRFLIKEESKLWNLWLGVLK
jgi:hypothetical protein